MIKWDAGLFFLGSAISFDHQQKNKNKKQKMDVLDEGTRLEGYMGPDSDHDNEKIAKEP